MSFNILGDHGLDIEILILKMVRRLEGGNLIERIDQTIPIDLSAISSLKIEDSLMNVGMNGAIEINNKSSILDQLGIAAKSSDDLYISITIKDKDLEEHGLEPHQSKIEFLGLIEKTVTGSANFQDNIIIFKFEEAFVAEMRHTSWDNFLNESGFKEDQNVIQLVQKYYDVVWKAKSKSEVVIVDANEADAIPELPLIANTEVKRPTEESFYDVFKRSLGRTMALGKATTRDFGGIFGKEFKFTTKQQHLPSFRFTNGESGIRVMKFKPYFTDRHREFIEEVRLEKIQGDSNDFSDVYTEKFTCGPLAQIKGALDPNTNWHNRIEGESITRPDVGTLRKDVWTNYLQTRGAEPEQDIFSDEFDITNPIIKIHLYAEVVENFIRDELALKDAGVNLPLIDPKSQTKKYVYTPADGKYSDDAIITELYNKLKTSFATVNEKISFTCKGAIYRTPGKFIWIERSATSDESLLEKLWYVNSVEHSIIDGKYQTEIIANRMFGDNTVEAFAKSKTETASYIAGVLEDKNLLAVTKRHKKEIVEEFVQELEKQSAPAPVYTPPTDFMSQQSVDELNMTDEAPARPDIDSTDPVVDVREDVTTAIEDKKQLQEDLGLTDEEMAERQKVRQVEAKEFFANKRRLRNLQKK